MLRWLICKTCKKEKHDTAFEIKNCILDLSKCLDCKYPNRWDGAKEILNKIINK